MATPPAKFGYAEWQKYDALVDALRETSEGADCGTISRTPLSNRFQIIHDKAYLTAYLHLQNWKWYPGSSKRVHILLKVVETIQCSNKTLLKSVVQIDYYFVQCGAAKLLQSVHYDFEGELDLHPLFHAQLSHTRIGLDAHTAREIGFEYDIDDEEWQTFPRCRIPTSDMTLASVLLCLAADHLGSPFFREFRKKALDLQQRLPLPAINKLKHSITNAPEHFRSSHWFAHMDE